MSEITLGDAGERHPGRVHPRRGDVGGVRALARTAGVSFRGRRLSRRTLPLPARVGLSPPWARPWAQRRPGRPAPTYPARGGVGGAAGRQASS